MGGFGIPSVWILNPMGQTLWIPDFVACKSKFLDFGFPHIGQLSALDLPRKPYILPTQSPTLSGNHFPVA